MIKLDVKFVFANPVDIKRYLGEFFNLARSMKKAQETSKGDVSLARNFEQLVELGKHGHLDANDQHVVHIVDWLWQYAFEQRASDIHIEPRRDVGVVRFRIDGVLHQVYVIPQPVLIAMTSRIKLLARMEIVEKRRPQDGRIKTVSLEGTEVELRISTMPTAFGEKLVMRIFTPEVLVRDYADLGFTPDDRERWEKMVKEPNGVILVTGPTGSGKTTTLYSSLKNIATPEVNVCTIEDPIEMVEPMFNQMQVQPVIGVDFATGVRTLMRQDPDIIMVGEVRDHDTAEMAVQAALTGHLVLSTLHTNDAPTAVTRLLDLGVPPFLLSSTLLGVMAQRLVRTLCPHCKKPADPPDDDTWRALTMPWRADKPEKVMAPAGCLECRMTGYYGRIGLYEIMLMTPGAAQARHARRRRPRDPRAGVQGRHEAAARVRRDEDRRRAHHRRGSPESGAAGVTSPNHSALRAPRDLWPKAVSGKSFGRGRGALSALVTCTKRVDRQPASRPSPVTRVCRLNAFDVLRSRAQMSELLRRIRNVLTLLRTLDRRAHEPHLSAHARATERGAKRPVIGALRAFAARKAPGRSEAFRADFYRERVAWAGRSLRPRFAHAATNFSATPLLQ